MDNCFALGTLLPPTCDVPCVWKSRSTTHNPRHWNARRSNLSRFPSAYSGILFEIFDLGRAPVREALSKARRGLWQAFNARRREWEIVLLKKHTMILGTHQRRCTRFSDHSAYRSESSASRLLVFFGLEKLQEKKWKSSCASKARSTSTMLLAHYQKESFFWLEPPSRVLFARCFSQKMIFANLLWGFRRPGKARYRGWVVPASRRRIRKVWFWWKNSRSCTRGKTPEVYRWERTARSWSRVRKVMAHKRDVQVWVQNFWSGRHETGWGPPNGGTAPSLPPLLAYPTACSCHPQRATGLWVSVIAR